MTFALEPRERGFQPLPGCSSPRFPERNGANKRTVAAIRIIAVVIMNASNDLTPIDHSTIQRTSPAVVVRSSPIRARIIEGEVRSSPDMDVRHANQNGVRMTGGALRERR